MAKITLNPSVGNFRGSVGDLVFKRYGEQIVVTCKPDMSRVQWSAAQQAGRERFRRAIAHSKQVLADPGQWAEYARRARALEKPIFSLVLADYYHNVGVGSPKSPDFGMYPRSQETSDSIPSGNDVSSTLRCAPTRAGTGPALLCWLILCLLCLGTLTTGCTWAAPSATDAPAITLAAAGTATPAPTQQPTQPWTPTAVATATAPAVPATETPGPTATATLVQIPTYASGPAPAEAHLQYQCFRTVIARRKDLGFQGKLIAEGSGGLDISPNGKWQSHLYYDGPTSEVVVLTADYEKVASVPYKDEWRAIRWLDNERWVIIHNGDPYNSAIVVNPFSGEEKEVILDLPDPYFEMMDNTRILISAIDTTLTRVVYFDSQGIGRLILWDIPEKKMLAWVPHKVPDEPIMGQYGWSPDGSQYITTSPISFTGETGNVVVAEELFSISRDGEVKQLTHLSAAYMFVRISQYRWSPDGRYIAFWLQTANNGEEFDYGETIGRLAIFDTQTQDVTDTCITSKLLERPVWSPDSPRLAFQVYFGAEYGGGKILMLDLENEYVADIGGVAPLGWMVEP